MGFPNWCLFSGPGAYLIRLRRGRLRCGGFEERVRHEIPSCGLRDLYERAGINGAEYGRSEETLGVAGGRDFAHTAGLETME